MPRLEDLIAKAEPDESEAEVEDEDISILMYTSGTTSLPKGVQLRFRDFAAYVTANVEMADGTDRGVALVCVPFYHIAGTTAYMTNIWTGRKLIVMPQFDAKAWLDLVGRERVTHAFVVPTMMKQIIDEPAFAQTDLSSLTNLAYGGAAMPVQVIRRAIEVFPKRVGFVNAYGQTETTSSLTVLGPDDHRIEGTPEQIELKLKRLNSIGKPLPDVEIRVRDEDGKFLPHGQVGEIIIRTPRIMKGYAGRDDDARLPDGWRATGDLGWLDDDGYVFFAGRKDDMIIRGGENIAPAEIETVLMSHPAVDECAVIGVPSVEWGQIVKAFVVRRKDAKVTRRRARRVLPLAAGQLQASRAHRVHRRAAEKSARQNPAQRSARARRRRLTPRSAKKSRPHRAARPASAGAIEVSFASGCVSATLRYPGSRAILTPAMAVRLLELFEHVEDDETARMLAITGAGSAFCIGFDDAVDPRLVESLAVLSKPVVAIINGDAFDEGLELAMAADIRVAISSARFAITQIKRGAMPHFGATQRLPRLVGAANALRLMLTGTALEAGEAMRTGLVAYLAGNRAELAAVSGRVAEAILSRAPLAARLVKDAVLKGYEMTLEQGIRLEEDLYALLQTTSDRAEGVRAFLEKRKPLFRGA